MSNKIKHFYDFGDFRFSAKEKCLWHEEELIQLSPNSLEVLNLLLENNPNVVTREEIIEKVWKDTFVDEANLTVAVFNLRKALGEKSSKQFIKTVPKKGYRFNGEIKKTPIYEETVDFTVRTNPVFNPTDVKKQGVRWHFVAIILLGVLLLGSFSLWFKYKEQTELSPIPVNKRNIKSVAVLPLKDLSNDEKSRTLSLGITDNLISRLGKLNRFAVRPLSAVDKFEQSQKSSIEFGRDLKVEAVLVGTIQDVGDQLRLNLKVLDVRDGAVIWTEKFDESKKDLFRLQDIVTSKVAFAVSKKLTKKEQELLAEKSTDNIEAYRLYLLGLETWLKREGKTDALEYFEEAVRLDPNFALAHLGIADYYAFTKETQKAENALSKALELNPNSSNAIATKAFIEMFHKWNWKESEKLFRQAIDLSPNSSKAHHWYAVNLTLQKRFAHAEKEMETALNLDPTSLVIATDVAELYYFQRNYDEAERRLNEVLQINPEFETAKGRMAWVRHKKYDKFFSDNVSEYVWKLKNTAKENESEKNKVSEKISKYEAALTRNDKQELSEIYQEILLESETQTTGYWSKSMYKIIINDDKTALKLLEKSLENKEFMLPYIAVNPIWDSVRDKPQFKKIVRSINLPI